MTKAVFICRGSASVGLGHVMRCRTVAAEMTTRADTHVVAIGDDSVCRALLDTRVAYSVAADDRHCCKLVQELDPDLIVFDLLEFDAGFFRILSAQRATVSISPLFNLMDRVDLAFSRAASPEHERLRKQGRTAVRTGCRYATIAAHCRRVSETDYQRHAELDPLAVAISMGGGDAPNNTLRILETLRQAPAGLLIWVVLGEGYTHSYQRLIDCVNADRRHEIILAKTTDSMWRILGGCSVAVLAGGITTYEAAYAGIPSIITLSDDRDRFLIDELDRAGACKYAGAPLERSLPVIVAALGYLNEHREMLLMMHRRCKKLLDNQGPRRIVDEILDYHAGRAPTQETSVCASA